MDLSQLEPLGKIAGIGGIAIGAVVSIINAIVDKTSSVPARQRASMLRLLAIGAFSVGALGIVASTVGGQQALTRGNDSPAIIGGGNVTVGPASPSGSSGSTPQSGIAPNAAAKTEGNRSPAIISGGNAVVSPPNNSSGPKSP